MITGGARRVGAEICRTLHGAGMDIILHHNRSGTEADALSEELNNERPNTVVTVQGNLRDVAMLKSATREAINQLGGLDLLVNNASRFEPTPLYSTNEDAFANLFEVNVKAPYFLAQTAAPYLAKTGGSIVNITDIYADRPLDGYAVYCATKAALESMTKSLALELGPDIRVNAIAPGAIMWPENESNDIAHQKIVSQTPLKKIGSPEDIASAVLYLATESFVNGQVISIDGGRSVSMS